MICPGHPERQSMNDRVSCYSSFSPPSITRGDPAVSRTACYSALLPCQAQEPRISPLYGHALPSSLLHVTCQAHFPLRPTTSSECRDYKHYLLCTGPLRLHRGRHREGSWRIDSRRTSLWKRIRGTRKSCSGEPFTPGFESLSSHLAAV